MTIYIRPIANILRSTPGIVILLFIWNAVTQLFINIDSPLHHYWSGHIDSAWFFTAGRAWMNGLTPYVDFADSKGPLLWLIYGIGYLISPHDFSGLYVISCVYYTAVLWMCYRTALIFLQGQKIWSFLAAAAMVIPYFCWIDVEVRAESWCQLQLSYCLYRLTLAITDHSTIYNRKAMAWMGIAIASVMLIKWNLAILYGIIPCAIIVMRLRTDSLSAIKSIAIFILAFICFITPFAAYLYYHGALSACINEYMLNAGNMMASINVSGNGTFVYYLKSFLRFITDGRCWAIVFCISSLMLLIRQIGGGTLRIYPYSHRFLIHTCPDISRHGILHQRYGIFCDIPDNMAYRRHNAQHLHQASIICDTGSTGYNHGMVRADAFSRTQQLEICRTHASRPWPCDSRAGRISIWKT